MGDGRVRQESTHEAHEVRGDPEIPKGKNGATCIDLDDERALRGGVDVHEVVIADKT